MFESILANPSVAEAIEILKSELFLAIWETFYVTVAATFFSILIVLNLILALENSSILFKSFVVRPSILLTIICT